MNGQVDDEIDEDAGADDGEMPEGDLTLIFIAETCALLDFPIELTLMVNGMLVTGQPIMEAEFHLLLAEQLEQVQRRSGADKKHDVAGMLRETFDSQWQAGDGRDEAEVVAWTGYIHLQGVSILRGSSETRVPIWRGNALNADGWYLGPSK